MSDVVQKNNGEKPHNNPKKNGKNPLLRKTPLKEDKKAGYDNEGRPNSPL